jgi:hypothetical protein
VVATRALGGLFAAGILGAALFALQGCGKEELAQGFAGGSSSRDKAPIPSTVNAGAAMQPAPAAAPAPAEPAVAMKGDTEDARQQLKDGKPIREQQMKYHSANVRDPFRSLISDQGDRTDLVDLSVVKLVGIVQGDDPFCIVEDAEGIAYVLRKGDRVRNGRVVSINAASLVASQTLLGFTTTVQLTLEEEGRRSHG